jgi:hypothetical protein
MAVPPTGETLSLVDRLGGEQTIHAQAVPSRQLKSVE